MNLLQIREKLLGGGYDNAHGSVDTYQITADILDALIAKLEPE